MSSAQSMDALARANEIRLSRAAVKRSLRAGRITISDAFEEECCGSMTITQLLLVHHRIGHVRTREMLSRAGINPIRRVRDLTDRQRQLLVAAIASLGHQ